MDKTVLAAILALFSSKGAKPEQEHVEILKDLPRLTDDDADALMIVPNIGIEAYNNYLEFLHDRVGHLATLKKVTRRKVFLQKLAGVHEDAMPDEEETNEPSAVSTPDVQQTMKPVAGIAASDDLDLDDDATDDDEAEEDGKDQPPGEDASAGKPKEIPERATRRHICLDNLFDPQSKTFSQADITAVLGRYRHEKDDELFMRRASIEQRGMFVDNREGYINGISRKSRPHLRNAQIVLLKSLLRQLVDDIKAPEINDIDVGIVPVAAPTTTSTMKVVLRSDASAPAWAIAVMKTDYWKEVLKRIEKEFANAKSPKASVRAQADIEIRLWYDRMQKHKEGLYGPDLKTFGEYMIVVIRALQAGVDPTTPEYKHLYTAS